MDIASIRLLAVDDGFHAIQLLLASERIQNDPASNLIIRQYLTDARRCRSEFRAFVYRRRLTALTQYNECVVDRQLVKNKEFVLHAIRRFFDEEGVLERLPYENCVLDLILVEGETQTYQVYLCEINPLAEFAGTGLFSWLTDREILLGRQPFEFRVKEIEQGQTNSEWLALLESC